MKFVPPAENRAPVRVGLSLDDGMMNAVHPRRDHNEIQNAFELNRQPPIGMMKESSGFECDEENEKHDRSDAKNNHGERQKADREKDFAEMESRGGTHVHVEISVMHIMKSPEERDHMVRPMPPPIGVIHQGNFWHWIGDGLSNHLSRCAQHSVGRGRKRCEDASHSKSTSSEIYRN